MIGHCMPASGGASLIKTALALHHKVLPPMLCDEPDPALQLETSPFYLNTETRPWIHGKSHPRRAGRSEEHTSELQSLMRISYAVFCLKKKKQRQTHKYTQAIHTKQYRPSTHYKY